ncbi:MAG: hypothetical protein AB1730_16850 [Myxococcota bacterium]|jgi:hypothetical protein
MQKQLDAEAPGAVAILGVNEAGLEASNDLMTNGRTLPWLQDQSSVNAWGAWQVEYRDVIVRDAEGRKAGVYNLTLHDLAQPAHFAALKQLLLGARR